MMLTYKIKHEQDFEKELSLARKIAEYALEHRSTSSKNVKHIGLKSAIANQILRKYSRNKTIKNVNSVKLTIPNQGIKTDGKTITIPCLKITLPIWFNNTFTKINQIEIGSKFAYVSVTYKEPPAIKTEQIIGVDRNTTHHVLVASNINTGTVLKLGKGCQHIHNKYKHIRQVLQKNGKLGLLKRIKNRESNIIKNVNHHISKKLVQTARDDKATIVLEDLKRIRETAKCRRKQRYSLNSWSFHQLATMVEYKAKKFGVPIAYVEPQYTSRRCNRCGHIDENNRKRNLFHCLKCGIVEDSGANAGFNIASLYQQGILRFSKDSDLLKGSTDAPREATL